MKEAASGSAIENYQQIIWGNRQRLAFSHVFCNGRCQQQQPEKMVVILRDVLQKFYFELQPIWILTSGLPTAKDSPSLICTYGGN
ncbi:hypothetical protein PGT21_030451 [Puccinia graminis f. sp. tritici]|uniref:Uncharacterized protein n=1 Tax=Puccinia graminis f. sp. tritici TaxID=56615 RepID=A0A5B0NDF6_PUCGR|nr:hypothetical protein PGTUg99_009001 [Puccinia graminis f. sp. tritici]KAA1104717.1 hypothetical protein PGT21_030451 [Puccinia graminis f. sp. tritici]